MINRNRYDHRKGAHRAVWIREDMTAEHGGYDIAIVYAFSILIHNECSWENLREWFVWSDNGIRERVF